MLFAFFAYKEQFAQRVSGLIDKTVALKMLKLQGERLADIVLTAPEADAQGVGLPMREASPGIELRDLTFRYADGEPEVLRGVSLRVEPGESVAIVGPSGCGKTTLLKLMLGVHAPTSGEVLIGGVPLARLGLRAWRDMIGVVMQDEPLFSGSIADNISFFDAQPDRAWIEQCARVVGRARRDRGHADGLPHADRRHGRGAVGRPEAAHPAGARLVQATEDPGPGRGDEFTRRRSRTRRSTRRCGSWR